MSLRFSFARLGLVGALALAPLLASAACGGTSSEDSPSADDDALTGGWSTSTRGYHGYEALPDRVAYLTFDDGPSEWTEAFLDTLRDKGIRGTFFVNGFGLKKNGLASYGPTMARIVRDGHALGNHTLHHPNLTTLSSAAVAAELDDNKAAINAALEAEGVAPQPIDFLRPPFGAEDDRVRRLISARGFDTIWNVDDGDSKGWAPGEWFCDYARDLAHEQSTVDHVGSLRDHDCTDISSSRTHVYDPTTPGYLAKVDSLTRAVVESSYVKRGKGIVVLMHDTHPTSRDALARMIDGLRASHYTFETIAELRDRVYGPATATGATSDAEAGADAEAGEASR